MLRAALLLTSDDFHVARERFGRYMKVVPPPMVGALPATSRNFMSVFDTFGANVVAVVAYNIVEARQPNEGSDSSPIIPWSMYRSGYGHPVTNRLRSTDRTQNHGCGNAIVGATWGQQGTRPTDADEARSWLLHRCWPESSREDRRG